jgi:hypothetical protein
MESAIAWCVLILLASNIYSLSMVYSLQREISRQPPGVNLNGVSELRNLTLADRSHPLAALGSDDKLTLLYVFDPIDCPTAVEELTELERLHQEKPALNIKGIAMHESPDEPLQTQRTFHLGFPIIPDTAAKLRSILRPPETPWKIILDPNGQALLEEGPSILPEGRIAFRHRASALEEGWSRSRGSGRS